MTTPSSSSPSSSEYTDPVTVCKEEDLQENEMKLFNFNKKTKVLVIKQKGVISAIGNECTHYGAPLETGVLGQGRIRCPWHGACFNILTGDIEDFPGLDSLPCYKVDVVRGEVKVSAKRKLLNKNIRIKEMVKRTQRSQRTYVIVGGGTAAGVCAETLRQEGFQGRIVMICREKYLPYDRVQITKNMRANIDDIQWRKPDFYAKHDIETWLGVEATKVDAKNKTIDCSNDETIEYEKLFIATGSRANKPPIENIDFSGIYTIRDWEEASEINRQLTSEMSIICLGTGFISLEVAAYAADKVKSVTVIGQDNVPLKAVLGNQIGQRILQLFEENDVTMIMNSGIQEIIGHTNSRVAQVVLTNGEKLHCDMLILGCGVTPYTEFLRGSGVNINQNGTIGTDQYLVTNVSNIYAGGDIAYAPVSVNGNERAAIGHYQLAQYHGRIAAINMAGKRAELQTCPFFFTAFFGKNLRFSGFGKFKTCHTDGDLANMKFVTYYFEEEKEEPDKEVDDEAEKEKEKLKGKPPRKDKKIVAVVSCGRDPIASQYAELRMQGKQLLRSDIVGKDDPTAWTQELKSCDTCICSIPNP